MFDRRRIVAAGVAVLALVASGACGASGQGGDATHAKPAAVAKPEAKPEPKVTRKATPEAPKAPETAPSPKAPEGIPDDDHPGSMVPSGPHIWLEQGSQGEAVTNIQRKLNDLGYGIAVDGDYGAQTAAAVRAFQRAWGLNMDGVWGPETDVAMDLVRQGVDQPCDYIPTC